VIVRQASSSLAILCDLAELGVSLGTTRKPFNGINSLREWFPRPHWLARRAWLLCAKQGLMKPDSRKDAEFRKVAKFRKRAEFRKVAKQAKAQPTDIKKVRR